MKYNLFAVNFQKGFLVKSFKHIFQVVTLTFSNWCRSHTLYQFGWTWL